MTDTSSIATLSAQHPASVNAPSVASPTLNGSTSDGVVQDDTEDYTIKCICSYGDDDGNTVYCENCETWQHIICYYQGKQVPEVHFCEDCDPRQLDAKRATENQRRLRERVGGGDRKSKRPPTKSHKKKKDTVATTEQTNGIHSHGRNESSSAARDQPPPAKRAKTSHRTSASIASMNGVPMLPDSRKRASSNANAYPSPTKSPLNQPLHPPIPTYTSDFLNLYDNDRGKNNIDDGRNHRTSTNSMSVAVTHDLTSWYDNPFALKQATGRQHQEVFLQSDQPLRPETWPRVMLREKKNTNIYYEGKYPKWKCLVLDTNVKKDDFIGEIRGNIGRLEDYCMDPDTRWNELHHPEPFVFFHPLIPIYIDSRAEGTQFRYVRRSCHPNISLKTFVTSERDFHHCFVANKNISAGTELTAMWYMDQSLINNGNLKEENGDEEEANRPAAYYSRILANFGDCACDSTECVLKKFDLRTPLDSFIKKRGTGTRGRTKAKITASPTSTGQATNSRANSENIQATEDEDQADGRSTSGSVRSKPHSRDITPANANQLDTVQESSLGISAREKRKILMAEKAFEDQESKKQRSKRKRTSGGTANSTTATGSKNAPTSSSLPATPSLTSNSPNLNTASPNNNAGSPPLSAPLRKSTNMSPPKTSLPATSSQPIRYRRPIYVDRGMQTDPEPEEPEEPLFPVPFDREKWKGWKTPQQKLNDKCREWARRDMIKQEEHDKKVKAGLIPAYVKIVPSWYEDRLEERKRKAEQLAKEARENEEAAAVTTVSPTSNVWLSTTQTEEPKPVTPASAVQLPPPPLPSQAAHTQKNVQPLNSQKLQLSTLPPVPAFTNSTSSATQASAAFSPTSTTPSVPQSPFGYMGSSQSYPGLSTGTVAPSPVKKKLSLGDYMNRRSNLTTPTVEKTQAQATGITATAPIASTAMTTASVEQAPANLSTNKPTSSTTMVKPDDSIKAGAKAMDGVEGSAIMDPPSTKDEGVVPATVISMPAQSIAPADSPELTSVLSTLQAIARRSSGGS